MVELEARWLCEILNFNWNANAYPCLSRLEVKTTKSELHFIRNCGNLLSKIRCAFCFVAIASIQVIGCKSNQTTNSTSCRNLVNSFAQSRISLWTVLRCVCKLFLLLPGWRHTYIQVCSGPAASLGCLVCSLLLPGVRHTYMEFWLGRVFS